MVVVIARKPLVGTLSENTRENQCGGINIDQTRIPTSETTNRTPSKSSDLNKKGSGGWKNSSEYTGSMNDDWKKGRWGANVLLSPSSVSVMDSQSGITKSPQSYVRNADGFNNGVYADKPMIGEKSGTFSLNFGDSGGASRYFKVIEDDSDDS